MKGKKQYARNKLFNLTFFTGLALGCISVLLIKRALWGWAIGIGVIALIFLLAALIFMPICYAFDSEGVSLLYIFFPTERYLWKNIRSIEVTEDVRSTNLPLYSAVFEIKGKNEGSKRSYMRGYIRKSFRTKHLLEKYWDGTITGYLFEDAKKWVSKRKAEKSAQIKEHLADEIVPMERDARAEAREWISLFTAQAKQYNLDVKTKYLYITEDFKESRSRPKENYTYTLLAEISYFNETDPKRKVEVSADLLHVRLGKTAYRGVKNEHAKKEFEEFFLDVIEEINKNGIESYVN